MWLPDYNLENIGSKITMVTPVWHLHENSCWIYFIPQSLCDVCIIARVDVKQGSGTVFIHSPSRFHGNPMKLRYR